MYCIHLVLSNFMPTLEINDGIIHSIIPHPILFIMIFFIGDTVLFKSEDQHGIITKLNSQYKVTVKTSDGFEVLKFL